jgi:hypothetical protein
MRTQIKVQRSLIAMVLALSLAAPFAASTAQAAQRQTANIQIPIVGTFDGGTFAGTFALQRFAVVNDQIVAVGTLTGSLTNTAGTVIGTLLRTVQIAIASAQTEASCEILHLELGPLDLNLLGLVVHLDRVVLDISAQPAPSMLGSLLCAVANLLNGGGAPSTTVRLLNQILAEL